ncbi:unnamed protein product [Paramecium sonneborni]|uniref:Uncharacterized protein n=1 Tax=Paramecium sonneborni TaxID=65129 RepID=A0A8S1N1S7_9CILI|nr:unnamed protein product [Paramecium sonneborni]
MHIFKFLNFNHSAFDMVILAIQFIRSNRIQFVYILKGNLQA